MFNPEECAIQTYDWSTKKWDSLPINSQEEYDYWVYVIDNQGKFNEFPFYRARIVNPKQYNEVIYCRQVTDLIPNPKLLNAFSWWQQYNKGQSIGKVIHHLYLYCGLHIGERATIGDGRVYYPREPDLLAYYSWYRMTVNNEVVDIPVFLFVGEHAKAFNSIQVEKNK